MLKYLYLLLFLVFSALSGFSYAQCDTSRYRKAIFDSVTPHLDVKYGEAPVWSFPYQNTDLYMDIYTPANDPLNKRPLMLWVHPGGFLSGDKTADDMVALCDSFARRGYVTATIGYRLGFNPLSVSSAERAVYRGTQDMRAAIRFLKENAAIYGIDTNYTFMGGSSAGGFATLHTAYLDQDEAPSSIDGGLTYPALGCLDCEGNNYVHGVELLGYTNLWGAIGDSLWIDIDEDVPGLLVHGTADPTVPYGVGHPFGVFTTPITHGSRSVSNQLSSLSIAHENYIVPGEGHEFHGADNGTFNSPPNSYWDTIFDKVEDHYFSLIQPQTSLISGPVNACTGDTVTFTCSINPVHTICWEVLNGNIIGSNGDSVQVVFASSGNAELFVRRYSEINAAGEVRSVNINVFPSPVINIVAAPNDMTVDFSPSATGFVNYIWDFGDGSASSNLAPSHTYNSAGLYNVSLTVVDGNGCKATKDTLMNFSDLGLDYFSDNYSTELYPNPAHSEFQITSEKHINELFITSVSGQENYQVNVEDKSSTVNVEELPAGVYIVTVIFDNHSERFKLIKQ